MVGDTLTIAVVISCDSLRRRTEWLPHCRM